ncbi:MAG: rRNA maturation RNase YbeY [Minisyncoccia bacterium]
MPRISITNTTKSTLPRVPFVKIKNFVLGEKYDLSLVFVGKERSRKLNLKYRGKNKETNVLSFPLSKKEGEIFINLKLADKQKKTFGRNLNDFVTFLFIHGIMHLKGMQHSSKMEKAEEKIRRKFRI